MKKGLEFNLEIPNDELIWKRILGKDIINQKKYWFEKRAINIWSQEEIYNIDKNTYFTHIKTYDYYDLIMEYVNKINKEKK